MTGLQVESLLLVGALGVAVILTREPLRQAIILSLFGMTLIVLFVVLQAPDVALSAAVVGSVGLPLMIVLTLAKIRGGGR